MDRSETRRLRPGAGGARARGDTRIAPLLLISGLGLVVIGAAAMVVRTPTRGGVEEAIVSRRPAEQRVEPTPEEPPRAPPESLGREPAATVAGDESPEPSQMRSELKRPQQATRAGVPQSPTATNAIVGRVVDPITSTPVNLFTIYCLPTYLGDALTQLQDGHRGGQTFRDPQGRFRMVGLEPGAYSVVIDAPGFKRWQKELTVPYTGDLIVEVGRGAYIDGKLTDSAGRPVVGYEVNLDPKPYDPKKFPRIRQRKTDNLGYYKFTDLAPGEYKVSMGSLANSDPELTSQVLVLQDDQHIPCDFTMPLRNTLSFTITDERGVALNSARIRCYDRDNHFNGLTDQNGESKIEHVRNGEYTLKIVCRGYRQVQEKLTVSGGSALIPVRRVLAKEKDPQ